MRSLLPSVALLYAPLALVRSTLPRFPPDGTPIRAFLSGYQVPLESLALVDIKENGAIQIVEEEESPSEIQAQQAELDRLLAREEPFDAIAAEAAVEAALKGAAEEDDEEHEEEEE